MVTKESVLPSAGVIRIARVSFACFLFLILFHGRCCAKSMEEFSYYDFVAVPMPKLNITNVWMAGHKDIGIPGPLRGKTVNVLGSISGKTYVSDTSDVVYVINGIIKGETSTEEYYDHGILKDRIKSEAKTIPSYESLHLPPFKPLDVKRTAELCHCSAWEIWLYSWTISRSQPVQNGGNMIRNDVLIGVENSHGTKAETKNIDVYLLGRDGTKYYPSDANEDHKTQVPDIAPNDTRSVTLAFYTPEDDFTTCLYDGDKLRGCNPFGSHRSIELEKTSTGNDYAYSVYTSCFDHNDDPVQELTRFISMKEYDATVKWIAFHDIECGKYDRAIAILDRYIQESGTDNAYGLESFLKLVALVKSGRFTMALQNIYDPTKTYVSEGYGTYLRTSCERQIERERAIERALVKSRNAAFRPTLKKLYQSVRDDSSVNIFISPYTLGGNFVHDFIAHQTPTGLYRDARMAYQEGNYREAKLMLNELVSHYPDENINGGQTKSYKAAPSSLFMLSNIYFKENNVPEAMRCLDTMLRKYNDDKYYITDYETGFAGATALFNKLDYYSGNYEELGISHSVRPNYSRAFRIAHEIIRRYDGHITYCYEFCFTYQDAIEFAILKMLDAKKAPMSEWEHEASAISRLTKSDYVKADMLNRMADEYARRRMYGKAAATYRTVIRRYAYLYRNEDIIEEYNTEFPMEAWVGLLKVSRQQKRPEKEIRKLKAQMSRHLNNYYNSVIKQLTGSDHLQRDNAKTRADAMRDKYSGYIKD